MVDKDGDITGINGEKLRIAKPLDENRVRKDLESVLKSGVTSLAILLLHSYCFRDHEEQVKKIAVQLGFCHVSISSECSPMVRAVPRGLTACADAYLTPHIREYTRHFLAGFDSDISKVPVLFMQVRKST